MTNEIEEVSFKESTSLSGVQRFLQIALPLLVILGLGFLTRIIINSSIKTKQKLPEKGVVHVETITAKLLNEKVKIQAMGTVSAANTLSLKPRIMGEVIAVNPQLEEGAILSAGEWVVKIDPKDYQLALNKAIAIKDKLTSDLAIEKGRRAVAEKELELFGAEKMTKEDTSLMLREPQLKIIEANLRIAEQDIHQKKLTLSRCVVIMPTNAQVVKRSVSLGSQLSSQQEIARLVDVDKYYLHLSIPLSSVAWLNSAKETAPVKIIYGNDRYQCKGELVSILPELETQGRMVRILIAIHNPLEISKKREGQSPLFLGSYVQAEILGKELANVCKIPRSSLRENSIIWIAKKSKNKADDSITKKKKSKEKKENKQLYALEIRHVTPIWKDLDFIFIQEEIAEGELIVISDLVTPIRGMSIFLSNNKMPTSKNESPEK